MSSFEKSISLQVYAIYSFVVCKIFGGRFVIEAFLYFSYVTLFALVIRRIVGQMSFDRRNIFFLRERKEKKKKKIIEFMVTNVREGRRPSNHIP